MQLSISMFAFALLTAGFLWPTEEAVSGAGLHLVVLWMLLGLAHAIQCWQTIGRTKAPQHSIQWVDVGVCLIAVGHLISMCVVFHVEGDRRAAMNLMFEWLGLCVAWWIFRSLFFDRRLVAQGVAVVTAICIGLSCFGIWQHHVFYAEQAEWYRGIRSELTQTIAHPDASGFSRRAELTRLLQERQIPMHGTARIAWENRLLSSSEPFGTFSLANTLAGILAAGLVLLTGQATSPRGEQKRMHWFGMLILASQLCLIGYCLILTKSRSAWLGSCVGLGILMAHRIRLSAIQHAFRWCVVGSIAAAILVGAAAVVGGLDREVILESPRSLQFRLLYWSGTLKMLREQPLAGAGPGNFRQVYLQYKADETSEEIRDPHNAILDAWSSSGLIGLTGLMLMIGWMCRRLLKQPSDPGNPLAAKNNRGQLWNVFAGLLCGFLLQGGWTWLNGSDEWIAGFERILLLSGIPLLMLRGNASLRHIDGTACVAAASAMVVNLLAAGGFEMPAVMITLLFCLSAGASQVSPSYDRIPERAQKHGHPGNLIFAGACLAGIVVVLAFGLLPVTVSRHHEEIGSAMLRDAQYPSRALDRYQRALVADPQNMTPRQRIAEVASYRLSELAASRAGQNTENLANHELTTEVHALINDALFACESLIAADRRNTFGYRLRAEVRWNAGKLTDDPRLQELALQDLQTVTRRYPSSIDAWLRLTERLDAAGGGHSELARSAAGRVLQLNQINHEWGHADRFLTDAQLVTVKRILSL